MAKSIFEPTPLESFCLKINFNLRGIQLCLGKEKRKTKNFRLFYLKFKNIRSSKACRTGPGFFFDDLPIFLKQNAKKFVVFF